MRAMAISQHGGPEVLQWHDLPEPTAGPRQVLVEVKAVGLNHLDLWVRRGLPAFKLTFPHILGTDIAGVVKALGPGATGCKEGDEVIVNPGRSCMRCAECLSGRDNLCREFSLLGEHRSGGGAPLIAVPDANIVPKPKRLS